MLSGSELWYCDGTTTGISIYSEISPGAGGSNAVPMETLGNQLILNASDDILYGRELYTIELPAITPTPIPIPMP